MKPENLTQQKTKEKAQRLEMVLRFFCLDSLLLGRCSF